MKRVYFDYANTGPVDPRVLKEMMPYFQEVFGNPSSLHDFGQTAAEAVDKAREKVAGLIGSSKEEIIFTASSTEANNFALKGIALVNRRRGEHIIISQIEHFSVLHPAKTLEKWGFEVTYLPVDKYGLVDPSRVEEAITRETILISIMHANNEIGTIEPIEEISKVARKKGVYLHSDASATVGIIPVNVQKLGVDALTFSAQSLNGPKGAGVLFLKKGVRIMPLMEGGIQEEGRRPGTENVPAIVGLGKASELAKAELEERSKILTPLRDKLMRELPQRIKDLRINGHPERRVPNNVDVCVEFVEGESILMLLNSKGIAVSSGSACTSRALKASHVLTAIGVPAAVAQGSLLFSLGVGNNEEEVDYLLETLPPIVERLRQMSPLYKE
ncbi:aminotransferase class V-fold PLP-dependent enzyme [Candidatus Aerophobetes bacterium]|uniref:Aminotransferase class V-fold PLP-dependent enzyme n=1 Tax=Aerophobetes bacterium TaxID=2030807 RepID=A0A523WAJ7_UNCAE|nr:MAG: aminotransferase class V-fold PLP-dependent enzyme [Candidatus Aerophobetes bacterium]